VLVLVLVAVLVLLGMNASAVDTRSMVATAIFVIAVGVCAGVGLLIASRLPGIAIGWLLSLIGLSLAASLLAGQYALYGLATAPGSVPAARLAGWCGDGLAAQTVMLLFFLILLFPDGRLPSPRWRPVLWAMFAVVAAWTMRWLQAGITVNGGISEVLSAAKVTYLNPVGIFPRHGWFNGLISVILILVAISGVLSVASVFARRRGAGAELRKQLAWLGYAGLMTGFWALALLVAGLAGNDLNGSLGTLLWTCLVLTLVAGIPLACAVAVLKYRLYDIDRIVSRTLEYAIVTGLLVGVYAGLVLLTTQVLQIKSPVAVAGSTLVAAALFSPLRRRVQRAVDRRFNRARYDAGQTIAAFADQLKDAVDLDAVQADLTNVVHQVLEPTHLWVWINQGAEASSGANVSSTRLSHALLQFWLQFVLVRTCS
jgi:hypothetical protein